MNHEDTKPSPTHLRSFSNDTSKCENTTPTRPAGPKHTRSITSWSNTSPAKSVGRGESTRFIQLSKQCVFMDMEDLVPPEKQDELQTLVEEFLTANATTQDQDVEASSHSSLASHEVNVRDSIRIQLSRKFVFMDMDSLVPDKKQHDLASLIEKFLKDEQTAAASNADLESESSSIRFSRKFVFRDMSHLAPHIKQNELEEVVANFLEQIPESQLIAHHCQQPTLPPSPVGSVDSRPTSTRIIEVSRKFVFMDMTDLVPPQYQDPLEDVVRTFLENEDNECKHQDSDTALLGDNGQKKRNKIFSGFTCVLI